MPPVAATVLTPPPGDQLVPSSKFQVLKGQNESKFWSFKKKKFKFFMSVKLVFHRNMSKFFVSKVKI